MHEIKKILVAVIITHSVAASAKDNCQGVLIQLKNLPKTTSQIIVVTPRTGIKAEISACQRQGKHWRQILPSFRAVIGESGIAPIGQKKERDLKTPAGLYKLGAAFGSQPLAVKMDYKYITADDKYVDDVNSKNYNRWVNGKTKAKSYETMLVKPYKMGIVVNYNRDPIIPGAGSAIFIHLWTNANTPTSGCIATNEQHLLAILHWLDKKQHPFIFIRST